MDRLLSLHMTSMLLLTLAGAYSPFLSCQGWEPRTRIFVMANQDLNNGLPEYQLNIRQKARGKSLTVRALGADRFRTKLKMVLESIAVTNEQGENTYSLVVFNQRTDTGFVSQFSTAQSTTDLYCTYIGH